MTQVWLLYGIGVEKNELDQIDEPPNPALLGVYSDLGALQEQNKLLRDETINDDGYIMSDHREPVDLGGALLLALSAYPVELNGESVPPSKWGAVMSFASCYMLCKAKGIV